MPRPHEPAPFAHAVPALAAPVLAALLMAAAPQATAQAAQRSVIQVENVRMDHAQVMRVRPVFQTLHATRMEQRCKTPAGIVVVGPKGGETGRFARFVEAVRDVLGQDEVPRTVDAVPADAIDCELVEVEREFRRAIAYDVDYVYKGAKYRSRLPFDPGNVLKVRVSVTPVVVPADAR